MRSCVGGFVLCVIVAAFGCGPRTLVIEGGDQGGAGLLKIHIAYCKAAEKLGRPPKAVADLTPFLKEQGDPTELLKSPNDNEPYVIYWNVDPINPVGVKGDGSPVVMAHEKTGKGGKRYVLTSSGTDLLDATQFADANFPKGAAKPSP